MGVERGYVTIYSLSVGCRNIVLPVSFERCFFSFESCSSEKCLCEYFMLFFVSLLSRESTVGTWDATVFREIRDLIPFHVFLVLFQFLSKYLS